MGCKCGPTGRNLWGSCCGLHNHLSGLPHKLGPREIGTSTLSFTVGKVRPRAGKQRAQRYWLTHDRAGLEARPLEVLAVDLLSWSGGLSETALLERSRASLGFEPGPQCHRPAGHPPTPPSWSLDAHRAHPETSVHGPTPHWYTYGHCHRSTYEQMHTYTRGIPGDICITSSPVGEER